MAIDFMVVPAPETMPYACVSCNGQKGPMVLTHREVRGYGAVMICQNCAKQFSRVFGFAPGKKLDELATAADAVNERDKEISSLLEQVGEWSKKYEDERREHVTTTEMLGEAHARVLQLESKLAETARNALALVGEID